MGQQTPDISVSFLGPLEVSVDGERRVIAGRRERHLLALLAAEAGRPVGVGRIVDFLWGAQPPRTATKSLQTHVSRLRGMLEVDLDVLARRGETYVLDIESSVVDGLAFREDVSRARSALPKEPSAALDALDRGLERWRAAEPADVGTTTAAAAWRRGWTSARLEAVELRAQACVATGRIDGVAVELEGLLGRHPDRDGLWATLMAVQAAAGDRTAAIETFHRARRHHAEELGLDPSPVLRTAYERLLAADSDPTSARPVVGGPPPQSAAPGKDRLARRGRPPPVLVPVVGRGPARATIERALDESRLVTITGTGGVGKTLLAAQVTTGHDPVAWVDLVARPVGSDVASTVLAGVGGSPGPGEPPAVAASMLVGRAPLLVVLDNCEHVLGSVRDVVTTLIRHCPAVRVLTTSRQPLDLAGERLVHLPPLPVDRSGPAVRLLTETVSRRGGTLEGTDPERIAALCERLDGLPLALELVAPLVRRLGVDAVSSRLDERFGLFDVAWDVTGRTRDLSGTVAWSEALLTAQKRGLFRELAVFAGPFDAASVAAVCPSVPGGGGTRQSAAGIALAALADRSLIEPVAGQHGRYRMLETVREHALTALGGRRRAQASRDHARWVGAMADEVATGFLSPDEGRLAALVDDHLDEIAAAHAWACDGGHADIALRIAHGVAQPMAAGVRGDLAELVTVAATRFGDRRHPLSSEVWSHVAVWRAFCDDPDGALAALEDATLAARSVDRSLPRDWWRCHVDLRLRAYDLTGALDWIERARDAGLGDRELALIEAGVVPLEASMGREHDAGRRARRLRPQLESLGSPTITALSDASVAMTAGMPPDETAALLAAAADRARAAGSWFAESIVRMLQAVVAGRSGDDAAAAARLADLLGEWGRRGSWRYEWNTVREAMVVLARNDRYEDLLLLLAAGERSDSAPPLLGDQRQFLLAASEQAVRHLGEAHAQESRTRGLALDDVEASEHARDALLSVARGG